MQVYGNLATVPEQYKSRSTGRSYWQFRIAESQKGPSGASDATFYTVRVMKPEDPALSKGDFVKVTGSLKTDYYLSREGKPTGTLLIIAFDATKIAKPSALKNEAQQAEPAASKEKAIENAPASESTQPLQRMPERTKVQECVKERPSERVLETAQQELESDWSTLYD